MITLYYHTQVVNLKPKIRGENHESVVMTSAFMENTNNFESQEHHQLLRIILEQIDCNSVAAFDGNGGLLDMSMLVGLYMFFSSVAHDLL